MFVGGVEATAVCDEAADAEIDCEDARLLFVGELEAEETLE